MEQEGGIVQVLMKVGRTVLLYNRDRNSAHLNCLQRVLVHTENVSTREQATVNILDPLS